MSRPIVLIAVIGIVIGMAVMILTVSITRGFQREIRAKVVGAGAHIRIASLTQTDPKETPRVPSAQPFYPYRDTLPYITRIERFATKPGIIETSEEIQGVIVKGIGAEHDQGFLRSNLVKGDVLAFGDSTKGDEVLLSQYLCDRLHIGLHDTITIYLVRGRDDIRPRKFKVRGIYQTGIEQVDHQLVHIDLAQLQRFAQWGLRAEIRVGEVEEGRYVEVEGLAFGGDRNYTYEWTGADLQGPGPHRLKLWDWHVPQYPPVPITRPKQPPVITLVVHDGNRTIPDTAWVRIVPDSMEMITHSIGTDLVVRRIRTERGGSGGSYDKYCGGFEVTVSDFDHIGEAEARLYDMYLGGDSRLRTITVEEQFPEIFAWLRLLDTNVVVVVVLMVIVAIINMTSALLIIIIERTSMIGVMKALGSTNGGIRRIFLIDAAYILGTGIVLGDALGIGLGLLQQYLGVVTLPIESYYVNTVPILLEWWPILVLNFGTLAVCIIALMLPSMYVARIAPAKAIRFD